MVKKNVKITQIQEDLKFLSSDELERFTGTNGEKIVSEYIIKNFIDYDLETLGDSNSFIQKFNAKLRKNPHSDIDVKKLLEKM